MSVPTVQYTLEERAHIELLKERYERIETSLGEDEAINMLLNLLWSVGEQRGWHKIGAPLTKLLEHVIEEMKKDMKQEVH